MFEQHAIARDLQRLQYGVEDEPAAAGLIGQFAGDGVGDSIELDRLGALYALFCACQQQQRLDQRLAVTRCFQQPAPDLLDALRIGVGQADLGRGALDGEIGAHLVRGVRGEALLGADQPFDTRGHRVEGVGKLPELTGRAAQRDTFTKVPA